MILKLLFVFTVFLHLLCRCKCLGLMEQNTRYSFKTEFYQNLRNTKWIAENSTGHIINMHLVFILGNGFFTNKRLGKAFRLLLIASSVDSSQSNRLGMVESLFIARFDLRYSNFWLELHEV